MPLMMKIVAAAAFRISHEDVPVLLRNLNEAILIAQANSVARLVCITAPALHGRARFRNVSDTFPKRVRIVPEAFPGGVRGMPEAVPMQPCCHD